MIDKSKLKFRSDTWDEAIFDGINTHNEYKLKDNFESDDIIIDIGSHIGSFIYAAYEKGARIIYGYEACKENFDIAKYNTDLLDASDVTVTNAGVYRSDIDLTDLRLHFSGIHSVNTGGGNILISTEGEEVKLVGLDFIIESLLLQYDKKSIRYLKIDCEGSEFPIFLTSDRLGLIEEIAGEYHEFDVPERLNFSYKRFTIELLKEHLESKGFEVTFERHLTDPSLGLFKAINKRSKMLTQSRAKIWNNATDVDEAKDWIFSGYKDTKDFSPTILDESYYPKVETCLDFGCGVGRNFDVLKTKFFSIDAFDLPNMLRFMTQEDREKVRITYDNWNDVKINKYDIIHACLVLQHIDEEYLRSYLKNFVDMSELLLLVGRSYLDDNLKNVLKIVLEYYNILKISSPKELCLSVDPSEHHHYTCLLKRK